MLIENNIANEWVELTEADREVIKRQQARATPSPKLLTLKDDSNNSAGQFGNMTREAVLNAATESVNYLRRLRPLKNKTSL